MEFACTVKVDEYAHFLSWQSDGREAQVLELSHVTDVRRKVVPKDFRIYAELEAGGVGMLDDRTLLMTSIAANRADIIYNHFACPDPATAQKWAEEMNKVSWVGFLGGSRIRFRFSVVLNRFLKFL